MSHCVEQARKTRETNYRIDSCHDGTCVRNLTMGCAEFETPLRSNPVYRNIAPMTDTMPLDRFGGRVHTSEPTIGAGYYPPKRDQIKMTKPPVGSAGKV